ncbi:MAG: hypothetical protein KatS3mg105_2647 [Gemmatales bacterium]|nr:MAG: hypothetical protein KatS3mg105_2647 [Gemmatales bacterium]
MIKRQPILPPEFIYPIDNWRLIEKRFAPELLGQTETIFSTANGYLGNARGASKREHRNANTALLSMAFMKPGLSPMANEPSDSLPRARTIVNVPDGKIIRLFVDDEPFDLESANIIHFQRSLDMRDGTLDREVLWETPSGRRVLIQSRRLISFHEKHLAAIDYSVTVLNAKASLVVSSEIVQHPAEKNDGADPRQAPGFKHDPLLSSSGDAHDLRLLLTYTTQNSRMSLGCGIDHTVATECQWSSKINWTKEGGQCRLFDRCRAGTYFSRDQIHHLPYFATDQDRRTSKPIRPGRSIEPSCMGSNRFWPTRGLISTISGIVPMLKFRQLIRVPSKACAGIYFN